MGFKIAGFFAYPVIMIAVLLSGCRGNVGAANVQPSASPELTESPTDLNLGNVPVSHSSAAQTVLVSNISASPITVSRIAVSGPFVLTGTAFPKTLNTGESITLNVSFTPSASGTANGNLNIISTAKNSPSTVTLKGSGVSSSSSPLALNVSPASLSFGSVALKATSSAQSVSVSNSSSNAIAISNIEVSGPFALTGSALPKTLSSGQSMTLDVSFTPSASGTASGSLNIVSNAQNSPSVVTLKGSATSSSNPLNLTVSPASLSFGTAAVSGSSADQTVTVSNNSSGAITVSNVAVAGPFVLASTSLPATLESGQSLSLNVAFAPKAAGAASGSLTINNSGESAGSVTLAGTAIACNTVLEPGDNLAAIVSASAANTTFCFNPGIYRMTTGINPKTNDDFIGLSPGAVLNGSQPVTSWTQSGKYWIASNQAQVIAQNTQVCAVSTSTACQFSDALFLDNEPLNRVMSLSEVVSGTFYRDYESKQIYIADNPTGHSMESIVCSHPLNADGGGANGVIIQGLTIEKFAGDVGGAVQGLSTWTIQNNEVRLNHGDGIGASGKILGNYSHNNGQFGLEGGYASTAMDAENNEFAFNNWASFLNGGGAKFEYATNLIVRNNYSHDNSGPGLITDGDSANVLYELNHTKNNWNAGIQHEISWNAIIRNNLLEDETVANPTSSNSSLWAHSAIRILNSSNVEIYGNTITNSSNGICGVLDTRGDSSHSPHTGQPYLLQNLDVHDNTFSAITYDAAGIVRSSSFDTSVYTSWNNHFAGDSYDLADPSGSIFIWMDSSGKHAYVTVTWAAWQAFGNDVEGSLQLLNSN
jgi:Right handed beta helix region/Abnormal spindle-like microcephaly-assoc'd, ASPM-SPD-2-Hydin